MALEIDAGQSSSTGPTRNGPAQAGDGSEVGPTPSLKKRTARGALVSVLAQAASLVLRTGSMVVLARLLLKEDFGLVNMVTAMTGVLMLFRDLGLSMATVQSTTISNAQISTLFWVNLGIGCILAALAGGLAPAVAAFYGEPRLFWITIAMGGIFVVNGAGAQHRAILQRELKFGWLVSIELVSLLLGVISAIAGAIAGLGYWSLVLLNVVPFAASLVGYWAVTRWIPGMPRRGTDVMSMLRYGGTVTLNGLVVYLAYNVDKVLLGKFWGPVALGVYGRAYQLISMPTDNLNSAISVVAFSALSRVQDDTARLKRYFMGYYSLFVSIVLPITLACALFADDIVHVLLGPEWHDAAVMFRLMSPTVLVFALINPFGTLMTATGNAVRSLRIAFMIAGVVIAGYVIGMKFGPNGVAAGFSISMLLICFPVIWWARLGTAISVKNVAAAVVKPMIACLSAFIVVFTLRNAIGAIQPTFLRLLVESSLLGGAYLVVLLFILGEKAVYLSLLRETGLSRAPRASS